MENFSGETSMVPQLLDGLKEAGLLEIEGCEAKALDLSDKSRFTKLALSDGQKLRLSGLMQQIPSMAGVAGISQAYVVKFPLGVPHTLVALKDGGFASMVRGADGKFVAHAAFYPLSSEAMVLGTFTAMSVVSGQYFLAQINNKLDAINQDIKSILGFLYGDKRAELRSELQFVQYSYQNYGSIMEHEQQRTATIASLQDARKVAMKDMEFYLQDLRSFANEKGKTEKIAARAVDLNKSLELTMQLYIMSSLLELYYAQNFDGGYVRQMERDISGFVEGCYDRMSVDFSQLKGQLINEQNSPLSKLYGDTHGNTIKTVDNIVSSLKTNRESKLNLIRESLCQPMQQATYYLDQNGELYTTVQ